MHVVKRNGDVEPVQLDQIQHRIAALCNGLAHVDAARVAQLTVQGLRDGMTTMELDDLASETSAAMATTHPQYATLAARISVSNMSKQTPSTFAESARRAQLHEGVVAFVERHAEALQAALRPERDYDYDFFAFRTLQRAYLRADVDGKVVETPQYMLMRIAVGIHHAADDLEAVLDTYDMLSRGLMSHATPTMFNAGCPEPQMASCFLMTIPNDSIQGIYQTLTWCAFISKTAGGIGVNVTDIRARGSRIAGSGGTSNGLVPMLRVFDSTARYVDQGGGKRKGAIAVYLEPWHADVFAFLELKRPHGKEELRARDLFYALWIPDEFMRRVDADEDWSLFCPNDVRDFGALWGDEFDAAYRQAEARGLARKRVSARSLWAAILDSQIESGGPYLLFKDACNAKSNHQHLGALRCSNLCTEILEYVSEDEVAVCNLASVALPKCVVAEESGADGPTRLVFDYALLERIVRRLVENLNRIIDGSYYPIEEARRSNLRHRPMGLGVQGLADVFHKLRIPFDSAEARTVNRNIFETLYFAALSQSIDLARRKGVTYESYAGSPLSQGKLSPDLWETELTDERHDWTQLRKDLAAYGAYNSLLVAPMPTASTAHILGNTEAFEPLTSNVYARRVLAGDFVCINSHLVEELQAIDMWTPEIKDAIVANDGSVQNVVGIPDEIKALYKTAYELKQRVLLDMARDRAPFVDQAMSTNLFFVAPSHAKLTAAFFHAWRSGLKNGIYYCRTRSASGAAKITVDVSPSSAASRASTTDVTDTACPMECTSCSA